MAELLPQQERFAQEFLVDLTASAAARRAGYGPGACKEIGYRLLTLPQVRAEVDRLKTERAEGLALKAADVVRELAKLAFANMGTFVRVQPDGSAVVDLTGLEGDDLAAVQEITVEEYAEGRGDEARQVKRVRLKLSEKIRALELLGKHLALFTEKHEVALSADRDVAAILQRRRQYAGLSEPGEG